MKNKWIWLAFATLISISTLAEKKKYHVFSDEEIEKISNYIKELENACSSSMIYEIDVNKHNEVFGLLSLDGHLKKRDLDHYAFSDKSVQKVADYIRKLEQRNSLSSNTVYKLTIPDVSGGSKSYYFRTLQSMDEFIIKEKTVNPKFAEQLRAGIDLDLVITTETERRKAYKMTTLDAMGDIVLNLDVDKMGLRENELINNDFILEFYGEDDKKQRHVFETLPEMNQFLLDLKNKDPQLFAQLSNTDGFDVDMLLPGKELKKYNFKNLKEMSDLTLSFKEEDYVVDGLTLRENDDFELEFNDENGEKRKYDFKTLPEMNNFLLNLQKDNPDLYANLMEGEDGFDVEMKMPGQEKKPYKFKTLDAMTDVTLKLKEEDFKVEKQNLRIVNEYDMEIVGPKGEREKYNFKSLDAMKEFLLKLEHTNPKMMEQLRKGKEYDINIKVLTREITDSSIYMKEDAITLSELDSTMSANKEGSKDDKTNTDGSESGIDELKNYKGSLSDKIDITKPFDYNSLSGKKICSDVRFSPNLYTVSIEYMDILNGVVKSMKANPGMVLRIEGHADRTGKSEWNEVLSEKRAKSVVNYLKNNGISTARLKVKGFGTKVPLDQESGQGGSSINRRVELIIR